MVTTLAAPQAVTTPGLHFKIPFIQQVRRVDMTIKGAGHRLCARHPESIRTNR